MANTRHIMTTSTTKITLPSTRKITQTLKAKKYILNANPSALPLILLTILILCLPLNLKAKSDFERLGDVLTLAPVGVLIVSVGIKDYEGALQLTAGSLITQGIIEVVKRSFELAHKNGHSIAFAKRPCCDDYKGMPSGHAGGAFSAAGFVFYRYGWKPALPLIGLGILTDASRVYAHKHSIWQVLVGSAIGWGVAWGLTTRYKPRKLLITPEISTDIAGKGVYGLQVAYTW